MHIYLTLKQFLHWLRLATKGIFHWLWTLLHKADTYIESYNYETLEMLFGIICIIFLLGILLNRISKWWYNEDKLDEN